MLWIDSDPVVGKREVLQGTHLSHMAGRALLSCAPPAVDDGRSSAFVTAETLRDIEGGFAASHVFVGIVASEAGKFSALAKASAGHQPDRLKSHRDWIIDLRRLR